MLKKHFVFYLLMSNFFSFGQTNTIWTSKKKPIPNIQWQHEYHQTLVLKLMLSQSKFNGGLKRKDNGISEVFLTIQDAFEVMQKIDRLTLGIPKIIYLVGWQYNGHDSKYPAWFEGNERLKRPQDKNTLESMRWLMREAKKYNTTVSLHINMFDAYEDSPLWNTYVEHNIIAKHKDGTVKRGEWGSPISYAQEWKTGFTQKRIDSLCALLPISEAGTIHIDAFHTWAPIGEEGPGKQPFSMEPISPYLNFTIADETKAQETIFNYWASKGIDVTSEGTTFLREFAFEGLQPMAWWVDWGLNEYMKWPANYYVGGVDRSDLGKLFGSSMHGEAIVMNDQKSLTGFKKDFFLNTVPWYYLNRFERLNYSKEQEIQSVIFSDDVQTKLDNNNYSLVQYGKKLIENGDILLPATWIKKPTLIAYSENGYEKKVWNLPNEFGKFKTFEVHEVTLRGNIFLNKIENKKGEISLTLGQNQAVILIPIIE